MNRERKRTVVTRITRAAAALREAERPLRIIGILAWPMEARERFLANGGKALPEVEYPNVDTAPVHAALADARPLIVHSGPAREWLERTADRIATAASMTENLGRRAFHDYSCALYGGPDETLHETGTTPLKLARRLKRIIGRLNHLDLGAPPDARADASSVASRMQAAVRKYFGDDAPVVEIVDELSANATTTPEQIRILSGALFTDRDVDQLIHHEAGIHVTTGLNGRAQDRLPILAASHPGTTRTQEGLAVFAEFITGCMDLDRLNRLADRVIAIHMAAEGADFIEIYRYFRESGSSRETAFEQARRVFRGGPLTGGAPFTKDVVYLDGLLRVHDFLRSVVTAGRADCLLLMFCGKLDLDDIPVLCELAGLGLLRPPKYLPPWAADRRFLVSYLAYSGFLGRVKLGTVHARYANVLNSTPVIEFSVS